MNNCTMMKVLESYKTIKAICYSCRLAVFYEFRYIFGMKYIVMIEAESEVQ